MEAQMINSFATILQMQQSEPTIRLQTSTDAMSNNSSTCPGFASFPPTLPVISLHSQQQQQNEIPLLVDSISADGSRASCTKKRPRLNGKQTDAGSAKSVGESDERETDKKVKRRKKAKNDQRNVIVKREVVHEACRECGKLVGACNDSLILHINHWYLIFGSFSLSEPLIFSMIVHLGSRYYYEVRKAKWPIVRYPQLIDRSMLCLKDKILLEFEPPNSSLEPGHINPHIQ